MDITDLKILAILQEDASLPVAEIAKRVNLSQTPCWKRVQKLELTGVITRRVALVDPTKVSLGLTAFVAVSAADHGAGAVCNGPVAPVQFVRRFGLF